MYDNEQKLAPYQRLKAVLNDGHEILTDKAQNNLDQLLDIKKKEHWYDPIINFFKKVDSKIFNSKRNIYSNKYQRRK